jgi:hypothetical protein
MLAPRVPCSNAERGGFGGGAQVVLRLAILAIANVPVVSRPHSVARRRLLRIHCAPAAEGDTRKERGEEVQLHGTAWGRGQHGRVSKQHLPAIPMNHTQDFGAGHQTLPERDSLLSSHDIARGAEQEHGEGTRTFPRMPSFTLSA